MTEEEIARAYRDALRGAGSIKPDGTYGEPEPDPTEARTAAALAAGVPPNRITSGGRVIAHRGEDE